MTEKKLGQMVETIVSHEFELDYFMFLLKDIDNADKTFDLLSRIRSTEEAEVIATVLFLYDELTENSKSVTEKQIFDRVMTWKSRWKGYKESEIKKTISNLSILGWMTQIVVATILLILMIGCTDFLIIWNILNNVVF